MSARARCAAAGAIAGLLLILAGSWLSTDGRLPPGLAAVVTRRRRSRVLEVTPGPDGGLEIRPARL
jgi:hypothetical protein